VAVADGDKNNEDLWRQAANRCRQGFNNDGWEKLMKILTRMNIGHEMAMKNQCWMVDGGEGPMSASYISRTHSSPTGK